MSIRERIRKPWKNKSVKYGLLGGLCLVMAGILLVANLRTNVRAEEIPLGTSTLNLELKDGVYQITSASELIALGSASAEQTQGKSFALANDITINAITLAANGTFAGTLNGNHHIVQLGSVKINNAEEVSHGVLFGTVKGSIHNLIINVETDVNYTRTSKVLRTDTVKTFVEDLVGAEASAKYTQSDISQYSQDEELKAFAMTLNGVSSENIVKKGGRTYHRVIGKEKFVKTNTYELGNAGTDGFGVLCGTLDTNASINQVYIKGNNLNVNQFASLVSTQTKQEGTRDKYFYYELIKKDVEVEDKTGLPDAVSVTSNTSVYDASKKLTGNASNTEAKLEVEAPAYIEKSSNLIYLVKITNTSSKELNLTDLVCEDSALNGTWKKNGVEVTDFSTITIDGNATHTYSYEVESLNEDASNVNFILNYSYLEGEGASAIQKPGTLNTTPVTTEVIDIDALGEASNSGSDLKISLKPEKANYMSTSATIKYTLTITNNMNLSGDIDEIALSINPTDIVVQTEGETQTINWKTNGISFSGDTLKKGDTIILTGTINVNSTGDVQTKITVEASKKVDTIESVNTYTYISDVVSSGLVEYSDIKYSESVESEADTYSGNHLNAGVFAGTSKGSITNSKQEMGVSGTQDSDNSNPREVLRVGGIIGQEMSGASAFTLYLLGSTSYDGEGGTLPDNSATVDTETMPSGGGWSSYVKYNSLKNQESLFDLAWLVKEAEFTYGAPDDSGNMAVSFDGALTNEPITYSVAYNARKSMKETSEDSIYISDSSVIELGDSGYYRCLNTYATDGYYHYTEQATSLDSAEWIYPYNDPVTTNPYTIDENDGTVERTLNPLQDNIRIEFSLPNNYQSGELYYLINVEESIPSTSEENQEYIEISNEGVGLLPFETDNLQYKLTPVIDGHIYPTQQTRTFLFTEKKPIPKPEITCFDYYDADQNINDYVVLTVNGSYEAETDMVITPSFDSNNTGRYTINYLYSNTAPISGEWDAGQRYIGSGTTLMESASEYTGSAIVPSGLANTGEVYLYVQLETKSNNPELYYFGPFHITDKSELEAVITSNGAVLPGDSNIVVDGDILKLEGASEGAIIEYMVSEESEKSYEWQTYSSEGIIMSQNQGGIVSARIKYNTDRYSEISQFTYMFGGICVEPRITPNTGISSDGEAAAATIGATVPVSLASRTSDAQIFYLTSDTSRTINMERVLQLPADIAEDGTIGSDNYKYFKVGDRWYRTSVTELQRYTESFVLAHDENQAKLKYVSAIAVADDYEISAAVEYIYKVQVKQQVEKPEAAFETRYMPGGETVEVASVSNGAKLTFYTVTPEAELYYAIGLGAEAPSIPIPAEGITVDGIYEENFTVRVQAKKDGMIDSEIVTFVYYISEQNRVSAPTSTPGTTADVPTVVIPGDKILLSSATTGTSIYYTLDGSSPQIVKNADGTFSPGNESTLLYSASEGISISEAGEGYFTITAVAVKAGMAKSEEVRFTYAYPDAVLAPYANIDSGKVKLGTQILLKNLTEDAVIYYTVGYGGEKPENPTLSSSVFSEEQPFTITQKTIIKAIAVKDGAKSAIATFTYEPMTQIGAVTASIESGSVVSKGTVLKLIADKGATIYYTTDGSDPTDGANTAVLTGDTLILTGEVGGQITVKAYAVASDKSPSEVVTFTYLFSQMVGGITASIESGSLVSNGTIVNLVTDISDADIHYTTDGTTPTGSSTKGTSIAIQGTPGSSFTIKAVVVSNGEVGIVYSFIYRIKEKPTAPVAAPSGGTLTIATSVSLDTSAEKIYYTIDGTEPTKSSNLYKEPILINRTTTLKAIAVSEDGEVSDVAIFQYTAAAKAEKPGADKEDKQILEAGTTVKLQSATADATIYYTTDGTEPTLERLEDVLQYDGSGIEIHRSVTIKAVAYRKDLQLSNVATWNYVVNSIPAVEMKEAEASKEAEEGLKDTDAGALQRKNVQNKETLGNRMLKDMDYQTTVTCQVSDVANGTVLKAKENEISENSVSYVKKLFGEDYTVLSSYYIWLKSGSGHIQPKGEVEVGIPIPEGYENATLTIVEINANHKVTPLETRRADGMLYTTTDSINKYAVVGPEIEKEADVRISYSLILKVIAVITLALGIIYFIVEKCKKFLRNRKYYPNE